VKRYLELFKENVLLIKFEDFSRDPCHSYRGVCSFLQIPDAPFSPQVHNPSRAAHSPKILFVLRKLNNYVIEKNRGGAPIKEISEKIHGVGKETVDHLAKVAPLTPFEKFRCRIITQKVAAFLKNCPEPYPYRQIKSKQERDRLMLLGLKAGKPPKLNQGIRTRLLRKYAPDVGSLSDLTGTDWSAWLKT
jgi:hypothetical protein